ncbi:MAG: AAA family ATPase [Mycobacterium sp.]|nr:AAA family ATPase [Mycobacterium sp.]
MSGAAPFEGLIVDREPAPDVFLLVGIPGCGKSTVAEALAKRLSLAAHIEGDGLQALVVSGGRWPAVDTDPEADRQLLLRARNAAVLARSFYAGGVVPVIDVVVRRAHLDFYLEQLVDLPLRLVVLAPTAAVAANRIAGRDKKLAEDWSFLDQAMREELAGQGEWIDSSALSVEETVDAVLALPSNGVSTAVRRP